MKKQVSNFNNISKTVSVITLLILASFNLVAQDHIIKIAPLQPLAGKFTATYERVLNTNSSVLGNMELWFFDADEDEGYTFPAMYTDLLGGPSNSYYNRGTRISGEYRRYLSNKQSASGLYGGLNLFAGGHKVGFKDSGYGGGSTNVVAVGGGLKGGYQLKLGNIYVDTNLIIGQSSVLGKAGIPVDSDFYSSDIKPFEADVEGSFFDLSFSIGIGF